MLPERMRIHKGKEESEATCKILKDRNGGVWYWMAIMVIKETVRMMNCTMVAV